MGSRTRQGFGELTFLIKNFRLEETFIPHKMVMIQFQFSLSEANLT